MFGMGLSLKLADFARLASMPKPVFIGLFGQLILLPVVAFSLATLFDASPAIAIGLMMLAACPGGTSSNLFTHIAKANLALSISLTAITTVVCVFTTPWLIAFSIEYFTEGEPPTFSLLKTSIGLIVITLIPVCIGMLINAIKPSFAHKIEPYFRRFSILFMILIIAKIVFDESDALIAAFPDLYVLTIALNSIATIVGMVLARYFLLSARDGITLGIEIGTQNSTLAILIAISFLNIPEYSLVAGVYGLVMYFGASMLVLLAKRQNAK